MGRYINTITGKTTPLSTIGIGNPCPPGMPTKDELLRAQSKGLTYDELMKKISGRVGSGDLL